MDRVVLKQQIITAAKALGFDLCQIASAAPDPADKIGLRGFLAAGEAGDMGWLDDASGRRGDPTALMPDAKTVIVLGTNYGPDTDPSADLSNPSKPVISVYARGGDYHDVIKKRLKALARVITKIAESGTDMRIFVDTGPVMEKPLAARAGLGWQGKHTNLVSRDFGSWLFLSEIVTNLDLPPDRPEADHCGSCDRCRQACPTDALDTAYEIRASRCISYLTIEHTGDIPDTLMAQMGNHVYGCDDCLAACPWNKFATPATEPAFEPPDARRDLSFEKLAALDDATFRTLFSKSPIKRTGRDRMLRNVAIAIGNTGDARHLKTAKRLAEDDAPIVAHAARWAVGRLSAPAEDA